MSAHAHDLAPRERRRERWESSGDGPPTHWDRSDAELLAAVRAGEIEAYAALVHRYRDSHARYLRCMLDDPRDVERVLQAAFVRAFTMLDRGPEPLAFGVWFHELVWLECERAADAVDTTASATDDARLRLRGMSLAEREAFVLHFVEELTVDEMQALTGTEVATLRAHLQRVADAASIAPALRERPVLAADFEARVMGAVRAEAHARGWLRARWSAAPQFALVQRRSAEIDARGAAPTPLGLLAFVGVTALSLSLIVIAAGTMR